MGYTGAVTGAVTIAVSVLIIVLIIVIMCNHGDNVNIVFYPMINISQAMVGNVFVLILLSSSIDLFQSPY